jgi:hypothetical protein
MLLLGNKLASLRYKVNPESWKDIRARDKAKGKRCVPGVSVVNGNIKGLNFRKIEYPILKWKWNKLKKGNLSRNDFMVTLFYF